MLRNIRAGRGFRFGAADVICSPPGSSSSGELLHGGALNTNPFENFPGAHSVMRSFSVNGRLLTPKINVAWQLTDVGPEDGGFVSASKSCLLSAQLIEGIARRRL